MVVALRSFRERLAAEEEKRRREERLRTQTKSFRSWLRRPREIQEDLQALSGRTAGQLNPAGRSYERARRQDTNLRPSNAIERAERALREIEREQMRAMEQQRKREERQQERLSKALSQAAEFQQRAFQTPTRQEALRQLQGLGPEDAAGVRAIQRISERDEAGPEEQMFGRDLFNRFVVPGQEPVVEPRPQYALELPALRYAERLQQLGVGVNSNDVRGVQEGDARAYRRVLEKAYGAQDTDDPEGRAALFALHRGATEARQELAPVGDPFTYIFGGLGEGLAAGAGAAGAPESVQQGIRVGTPLAGALASGGVGLGRLPSALRPLAAAAEIGPLRTAPFRGRAGAQAAAEAEAFVPQMRPRGAPPPRLDEPPDIMGVVGPRLGRELRGDTLPDIARTAPEPEQVRPAVDIAEDIAPPRVQEIAPEVAPPPAGARAAEPQPQAAGGAPLSAERFAARPDEAVREVLLARPGRETREVWRLYEGAKGQSRLQRRAWKLEQYQQARQAGIHITPDAGFKRQPDNVIEIMERLFGNEQARGRVGSFRPTEQPFAEALYERIDQARLRLQAADPEFDIHRIEEYFPHLFAVDKRAAGAGRSFVTRPGFKKPRELEGTLAEVLEQRPGLDLKTWDPVDYVSRFEGSVDEYIASMEAIRTLRAKGIVRPANAAPADWRVPDVPAFRTRQALQNNVAHPEAAKWLERMFKGSVFDEHGALRAVRGARDTLFRVKVLGGFFQQIDFSGRAILGQGLSQAARGHPLLAMRAWFSVPRAIGRSLVPAIDNAMVKAAAKSPELNALYRNGLSASVDPSFGDEVVRGLGGIVPQSVAGRQIPAAPALRQVTEFMSGGMYQKFHQGMLEQAGIVNLHKNLNKGFDLEEAARRAVEETNVFYSSTPNWQSAIKSATGRDMLRLPIFAPGEFEGWFRLPVQAPAEFAGMVGGILIIAELMNKQFTGNWLSKEQLLPYEIDKEDLGRFRKEGWRGLLRTDIPFVDYNTKFLRPELPWRGPDGRKQYLDLLGQADTPFRWALDPVFAVQTRLGQLVRLPYDVHTVSLGEAPPFGEKVESPADAARFAFQQVSPIPLGAFGGTERERIGETGAYVQAAGLNVSSERFGDLIARRLAEDVEAGLIRRPSGQEEWPPRSPGSLPNELEAAFWERHPELAERREEFQERGVEEGEPGAVYRQQREGSKAEHHEAIDRLISQLRRGDLTLEQFKDAFDDERQRDLGEQRHLRRNHADFFAQFDEGTEPHQRAVAKYIAVIERHPNPVTPEDWDARDADIARSLTTRELDLAREELAFDDHPFEKKRVEAIKRADLDGYYDLFAPEDARSLETRRAERLKERWRRSHPDGDALLWALGRTSCVRSGEARERAASIYRSLYGGSPQEPVRRCQN